MKKLLVAGLMAVTASAFAQSSASPAAGTPPEKPAAAPSYGAGPAGGGNDNTAGSMGKGSMSKDSMHKGSMGKDSMHKDSMSKGSMGKSSMNKSSMKDDPSATGTPPEKPSAVPSYGAGAAGGGNSNKAGSMK